MLFNWEIWQQIEAFLSKGDRSALRATCWQAWSANPLSDLLPGQVLLETSTRRRWKFQRKVDWWTEVCVLSTRFGMLDGLQKSYIGWLDQHQVKPRVMQCWKKGQLLWDNESAFRQGKRNGPGRLHKWGHGKTYARRRLIWKHDRVIARQSMSETRHQNSSNANNWRKPRSRHLLTKQFRLEFQEEVDAEDSYMACQQDWSDSESESEITD